jgi:hypothetical protein
MSKITLGQFNQLIWQIYHQWVKTHPTGRRFWEIWTKTQKTPREFLQSYVDFIQENFLK